MMHTHVHDVYSLLPTGSAISISGIREDKNALKCLRLQLS